MFLKTESFEHNGVTVTLSELSALQRIEHLALMKRQAEQAESDSNRKFSVEDSSEPVLFWWRCPCGITIRRRQSCLP
ncbi:phage minor tail protein G [Escherichia coli 179550]|nr:phage minor tail protein G [Escherichia coli 179550]